VEIGRVVAQSEVQHSIEVEEGDRKKGEGVAKTLSIFFLIGSTEAKETLK